MKPILYTSPYVPAEWVAAYGLEPMRLVPGREGGMAGPVQPNEGVCPFMRLFVNEALQHEAAGIVLATTCDQMRHAWDVFGREVDRPCFLLNVPSTWKSSAAQGLYRDELVRLGRFLESVGGMAPSRDVLVETMETYARRRQERMVVAAPKGDAAGVPVALLGGHLTGADLALHRLVAESGGRIVLDATEEGERAQPAGFDCRRLREDPLGVLVAAYFGAIPDVFRRPNGELFAWVEREVAARKVRGVILVRQVWCDKWQAEVHRLRELLEVPLLDVDFDGESCGARSRTRIAAFMEVVG